MQISICALNNVLFIILLLSSLFGSRRDTETHVDTTLSTEKSMSSSR